MRTKRRSRSSKRSEINFWSQPKKKMFVIKFIEDKTEINQKKNNDRNKTSAHFYFSTTLNRCGKSHCIIHFVYAHELVYVQARPGTYTKNLPPRKHLRFSLVSSLTFFLLNFLFFLLLFLSFFAIHPLVSKMKNKIENINRKKLIK